MRRSLTTLLLLLCLSVATAGNKGKTNAAAITAKTNTALTGNPSDTVIVKLKGRHQVILISEKGADLKTFRNYDLNRIIRDVDSASDLANKGVQPNNVNAAPAKNNNTNIVIGADNKGIIITDSSVTIGKEEKGITIDDRGIRIGKRNHGIDINDTTIRIIGGNKREYIIRNGRHNTVRISRADSADERRLVINNDDNTTIVTLPKKERNRVHYSMDFDIGLNNYLEAGSFPDTKGKPYGLDPLGSRFFAMKFLQKVDLGTSDKLTFAYGIEFAWNNFMFAKDVRIRDNNTDGKLTFDGPEPGIDKYIKSKFVLSTLNVPMMLHVKPGKHFRLAAGGFIGMRLTSWDKIKYEKNGNTEKDHNSSNFNLNNFQYGLRGEVGFRGVNLFCNYNMNSLFASGNGNPDLNALAFGITF
ncbi:MAG: hypothetical protein V4543_09380 [Bacteroidota bacterium]